LTVFENMHNVYLGIVLAPLAGAVIAGLFGKSIGRAGAHWVTIIGVAISFILSLIVLKDVLIDGAEPFDGPVYIWALSGGMEFQIGFLVDRLTALMITVVSFVSLMVHIYTIGYMHDDPGYQRFFSYIALFTFSMLMLVMANNFLQLFFGWEAVGLVSYLLIGFWYTRESAIFANLKAFLVNRVGDFGFLLGIAAIATHFGTLDYHSVFEHASDFADHTVQILPGGDWSLMTVICILLFIGAMGKSAQIPLHVWLPDSMEGPTPISALIHAATMVTAGIFMVARMSPLYELSEAALTFVMWIGAATAFLMGLVGIVQNDIKRVIAYSTLSQLGYMTVALGVSAYSAAIFHLMTHAFFKALLFLAAGSVIIAMHHEQDIRHMGGIRKYMPITFVTSLIGSLALIGFPGFSGFFSKDVIIESVHHSELWGAGVVHWIVLVSVFVTALYSFRMFFLVFHGKERMDEHTRSHLHESPRVVTVPLILLAIPSVFIGYFTLEPVVFGDYFGEAITVLPEHDVLGQIHHTHAGAFMLHALKSPIALILAALGVGVAGFIYLRERFDIAEQIRQAAGPLYTWLDRKYGFDDFNEAVMAAGTRGIGRLLWRIGDVQVIDGWMVNGSARAVGRFSSIVRHIQTGYLYTYAFAMIMGLLVLLTWFVFV
jgi:NADH-quinone oxidoreductase subunit L